MGSVISRYIEQNELGQFEEAHEKPSTFEAADALAGHRVDRRRSYAIQDGKLNVLQFYTHPCSGCHESCEGQVITGDFDRGIGCDECGYTGKRRTHWWMDYKDFLRCLKIEKEVYGTKRSAV